MTSPNLVNKLLNSLYCKYLYTNSNSPSSTWAELDDYPRLTKPFRLASLPNRRQIGSEMESFRKVLVLENEVQAQLMDGILTERGIPHFIRSYDDLAYGGIFQSQKGWGHLEAPESLHDEVRAIFDELNQPE